MYTASSSSSVKTPVITGKRLLNLQQCSYKLISNRPDVTILMERVHIQPLNRTSRLVVEVERKAANSVQSVFKRTDPFH